MFSSTMTESDITSPSSTTPSTEFSAIGTKKGDKISYRKSSKPMMERKRRARINNCLTQLKSLVLQAMKKDNSQYSKLEKADILELTVKHLKHVQRIQAPNTTQIPEALNKYRAGFNECANEVMRYLGEAHGVNSEARTRILSHLSTILTPVNTLPLQQTNHPHILPAPAPPQQHQLQPQQQQQQQLQTSHQLLHHQQQQELLQRTFQNELLQQANQQHIISGFHQQQPQLSSLITDHNNNNTITNSINRNHINPNANKSKDLHISSLSSSNSNNNNSHIISRDAMQQEMKQTIPDSKLALQALNVTACTTTPSIHLPCIATPAAAMATAPFQLVHSTLPNGQVALVLAPQTVSAMNIYTQNPASLISHEIAVSVLDNQQQQMKQLQEQSLKPPPPPPPQSSLQEELQRQQKATSPVPSRVICHDNPLSLVNRPASPIDNKPDIESMIHADSRLHQPSAFRLPSSLPSSSSSSASSSSPPKNTISFSSSASQIIPPPIIKVAKKISTSDVSHSSTYQSGVASSKLGPSRKSVSTTSPSKDDVVRCPENVTSVRELFEYKMGKRRMESSANSNTVVTAKSTWRPW